MASSHESGMVLSSFHNSNTMTSTCGTDHLNRDWYDWPLAYSTDHWAG